MNTTRLLVTGFEPFGGMSRNPSQAVLEALPDSLPSGAILVRTLLPVDRHAGPERAIKSLDEHRVDAVVGMGVALGTSTVQVERVFINLCIDGAEGPLADDTPDAHFSNLPTELLRRASADAGVSSTLSYSAGTYICNALGYQLRHQRPAVPSGFVHLPMTPGPDVEPGTPTLTFDEELTAVTAILCALDLWLS